MRKVLTEHAARLRRAHRSTRHKYQHPRLQRAPYHFCHEPHEAEIKVRTITSNGPTALCLTARGVCGSAHVFNNKLFFTRDVMDHNAVPKHFKIQEPNPKPQAQAPGEIFDWPKVRKKIWPNLFRGGGRGVWDPPV